MSQSPIKSASKKSYKKPFYKYQSNGGNNRYVVSVQEKQVITQILADFINQTEENLQIKVREYDNPNDFTDYIGSISNTYFDELLEKYDAVLFHNGSHELMLRNPITGEYVAFDDHGLLFIYTDDKRDSYLKGLGLKKKSFKKLIYEYGHWHVSSKLGREQFPEMIKFLGLVEE